MNADYAYTQDNLLKRELPKFKYSCSVYLIYLGLKKKIEGLAHHNLFFAKDLDRNLDQIFKESIVPEDPSFYIHVPTVTDSSLASLAKLKLEPCTWAFLWLAYILPGCRILP